MKIKNNPQRVSFKAGLTPTIKIQAAQYSAASIERLFQKQGVNADFKNNRAIAYCCGIVNDIFETLTTKYKLPFGAKPPSLTVYQDWDLINYSNTGCLGFCLPDSEKIISGKGVYVFGYDGTCTKTLQRYNTFNGANYAPNPYVSGIEHLKRMQVSKYTPQQREIIKKEISEYAAGRRVRPDSIQGGNPFELIASAITKEVVDVLDPDTLTVTRNSFYQAGKYDQKLADLVNSAWYNIAGG